MLLVSAELDEILSLSDRIGVLYRGRLVGTFDAAETPGSSSATSWPPERPPTARRWHHE